MDIESLAHEAVDTVTRHLRHRGADAAGRLANAAVDRVYRVIAGRLRAHPAGRQALRSLLDNPADLRCKVRATELVAREAGADRSFAETLDAAARNAGIVVQGAAARYQRMDNRGDYRDIRAGRDVNFKNRQYRIGSIRFGTGGLVSGIAVLVVALGGGTAAVVSASGDQVSLSSAVGRWERPGQQAPSFKVGPAVLTVDDKGAFTFTMNVTISVPGQQVPGFSGVSFDCHGTVEPAHDHYTLRSSSGQCGTFDARLSSDGHAIDLFLSSTESSNGSLTLTKAGASA
ncbi:hypothetical protein [Labedaea rhizosphaerae]|uniref:Uncharacterized protein n=1 Tax=Labedaea rhizosphaerae TaxID=598644 RepID=A0A4R6SFQ9_LABRH|nr:hypothetical protein [Labedaea rhizosphaerae]TDQ00523.1 hypothetical protein EV186_102384 [Labedaea rhizosphaerae]